MNAKPEASEYPAHLYAAVHDGNVGDVDFYQRHCAGVGSVLELGCGDARVLAALDVPRRVGIDLDPDMLQLARTRDPGAEFVCADMSDLQAARANEGALEREFERVIVPHGGLFCMLESEQLDSFFAGVAQLLAPGGDLLLDCWAADAFHSESEPNDLQEGWLERVKTIELDGERWEVLERSSWHKDAQRIDATYVHVRVGTEEAIEGVLRQRYVLAEQLRASLTRAGLELVSLWGDFEGGDYDSEAGLMVARARRRQ